MILATGRRRRAARSCRGRRPQLAALDQWVRMGGQLILSVGAAGRERSGRRLAAGRACAGHVRSDACRLRQSTVLETYAETSEPLGRRRGRFVCRCPSCATCSGRIEAYAGNHPRDLPLVVRTPHGFGEVVFVAFDLERAAAGDTGPPGRSCSTSCWARPIGRPPKTNRQSLGQVTTLGFVDLAGQLRGALDQFAGVQLVPFWLVAAAGAGLHRLHRAARLFPRQARACGRMEATWLTFALTVVAVQRRRVCAGLWTQGARAARQPGRPGRLRRRERPGARHHLGQPVQPAASRPTTCRSSREPRELAERRPPMSAATRVLFSWLGLPGDGFGGMDAPRPAACRCLPSPTISRAGSIALAARADRGLVDQGVRRPLVAPRRPARSTPSLRDNGKLAGTLDQPARRAAGRLRADLRPLGLSASGNCEPGQSHRRRNRARPADGRHLSAARHGAAATATSTPPYDRASFDVPRIVEIMTRLRAGRRRKATRAWPTSISVCRSEPAGAQTAGPC